jgi:hypothetical protein
MNEIVAPSPSEPPSVTFPPPDTEETAQPSKVCISKTIRIRTLPPVHRMVITLLVPEKDEQCPIMMEPIEEYELPFAPRKSVAYRQAKLKKIRLPCGHEMSAVACIYHFAKMGMHCPLCRRGSKQKLDVTCLHDAFRKDMQKHIKETEDQERAEREAEDRRVGVAMLMSDILQNMNTGQRNNNRIVLCVYCYSLMDPLAPSIHLEFKMMTSISENGLDFVMTLHDTRVMSMNIQNVPFFTDMELALGIRTSHGDFVFLDRSQKIAVRDITEENTLVGRTVGKFHMSTRFVATLSIMSLKWSTTLAEFPQILERNVQAVRVST